ncbi:MAG: DUF1294 domain-containing protein [Planctomycetota bacterium]|jgi:uncharacterized membrane protein YsdA (DUF1294 family)
MTPLSWILLGYVAMSLVAFIAMGVDKRRAIKQRWRVPESTLHGFELLGGAPGSLLGQLAFRHKTRKPGYQVVFWLIVALHVAGWAFWWLR